MFLPGQQRRERYLGGSERFGYRATKGGLLKPVLEEKKAIRSMVRLRRNGKSFRAIATAMKKKGFVLSHVAVKNVVAREAAKKAR